MSVSKTTRGAKTSEQGDSIQALPLNQDVHAKLAISAVVSRGDMTGADIIRLASSTDAYIKWGVDNTVVADVTDVYFPAGVEVLVVPDGMNFLAIIQESSSGVATMTKLGDS